MTTEFQQELVNFSNRISSISGKCSTEEGTKQFLVLPFLEFLGYDCKNPSEVCPECSADFSDKYKNRVDYAILRNEEPVIAVECKCVGSDIRDDRGQLRSYFNAVKTIKLGILTNGTVYEFYADSDEPNMMDQTAFLSIDLIDISRGKIEDSAIDGLSGLKKSTFDPENIGAEAKKKIIFQSIVHQLDGLANAPSEAFTRMLLQNAGLSHIRTKNLSEYQDIVKVAFREFINLRILQRLDISTKESEKTSTPPTTTPELPADSAPSSGIITTETEIEAFHYAKERLAFLVRDEDMFSKISEIQYRDYLGKFIVFYKKERKGRLFEFLENKDNHKYTFIFPDGSEFSGDDLSSVQIDKPLLETFQKRLAEA
ncbi:type I restriction endonuclease [Oleispirillum naphthae]|uniref:type I restriction endonuclease n=1 Tax=Oleispirillum naphthae TaxID=2838853 RepID=UPI003082451A